MVKKQLIILWAGIAIIVLLLLFPPTDGLRRNPNIRTDFLLARVGIVCFLTTGLMITFHKK